MSTGLVWKKSNRIRKNDDFKAIFLSGKKVSKKWFRLCFLLGNSPNPVFGITITKKLKGAVVRNYYKRIIREILRKHQYRVQPGWKIIINISSPPETRLAYQKVQDEILGLLKYGKVLFPE